MGKTVVNTRERAYARQEYQYDVLTGLVNNMRSIERTQKGREEFVNLSQDFANRLNNNSRDFPEYGLFSTEIRTLLRNNDYDNLHGQVNNIYRHLKNKRENIRQRLMW